MKTWKTETRRGNVFGNLDLGKRQNWKPLGTVMLVSFKEILWFFCVQLQCVYINLFPDECCISGEYWNWKCTEVHKPVCFDFSLQQTKKMKGKVQPESPYLCLDWNGEPLSMSVIPALCEYPSPELLKQNICWRCPVATYCKPGDGSFFFVLPIQLQFLSESQEE